MSSILKIEDLDVRNIIVNAGGGTLFEAWEYQIITKGTFVGFTCPYCKKGFVVERVYFASDTIDYHCDMCRQHILTVGMEELARLKR